MTVLKFDADYPLHGNFVEVETTVRHSNIEKIADPVYGIRTSLHVTHDPITKRSYALVYSDDGHGNGDLLAEFPID